MADDSEPTIAFGRRFGGADLGPIEKVIGRKQTGDISLPSPKKAAADRATGKAIREGFRGVRSLGRKR